MKYFKTYPNKQDPPLSLMRSSSVTGRTSLNMLKMSTPKSTMESKMKLLQTDLFFNCPLFFNRDQTSAEMTLPGIPIQQIMVWIGENRTHRTNGLNIFTSRILSVTFYLGKRFTITIWNKKTCFYAQSMSVLVSLTSLVDNAGSFSQCSSQKGKKQKKIV